MPLHSQLNRQLIRLERAGQPATFMSMPIKTEFVTITLTEHAQGAGHTPQAPTRTLQIADRVRDRVRQQVLVAARVAVMVWQQAMDRDQATARDVITARDQPSLMPTKMEFAIT